MLPRVSTAAVFRAQLGKSARAISAGRRSGSPANETIELLRILFGVWLLFIVALSFAPFAVKLHLTIGPLHNTGHFLVFFVAAVLGCWGVTRFSARLFRCVGITVLAMALEGVEKMLTYRNPYEWRDVGFDCVGILAGLALTPLLPVRSAPAKENSR